MRYETVCKTCRQCYSNGQVTSKDPFTLSNVHKTFIKIGVW